MEIPYIEVFGVIITEPLTLITDFLLAGFGFLFGHILFRSQTSDTHAKLWSLFFLFMGIAATLGGIAHGLSNYVGINMHYASRIAAGLAIFSAQIASLELIKEKRIYSFLRWFAIIELIVLIACVLYFQTFAPVIITTVVGLIGMVTPVQLYVYWNKTHTPHLIIVIGIVCNIIPGMIHALHLSYNKWFNSNDISHIIMIFFFYIIYSGVRKASSSTSSEVSN
ncbi:MAG: hypothetical protein ABFS32_03100 [Bacteroidota bacterium]